jgi:hypothetical protein
MFDGNVRPVQMLSYAGNGSRGRFGSDQRHGLIGDSTCRLRLPGLIRRLRIRAAR